MAFQGARVPCMREALILQHVGHEDCGLLAPLLSACGLAIHDVRLDRGEPVPPSARGVLWVVMGGPMGVGDLGDPRYPFLEPEADAIRARLAAQQPMLGICLGAQLIAHAAGAAVYPNRGPGGQLVREVGWGPVDFAAVADEPSLLGLGSREVLLHWHGDTFDLPALSVHLASTPRCANQAFRLGRHAYALQFHPEVPGERVDLWCAEDADYVLGALGPQGASEIAEGTRRHGAAAAVSGTRLLANILADLGVGHAG